ncbi:MAG: iron-sulfur cluster loop [Magnetococcales bacterium]|nr:iron-sulfur cluster loop [Magnetococcales bacterium]
MMHTGAADILIQQGKKLFEAPKRFLKFTNNEKADSLLNDLESFPHAYVLACIMDRQIPAERAWIIPYRISEKIGGFQFPKIHALTQEQIRSLMAEPDPLHRFVDEMSLNFYEAVSLIADRYAGSAANIWADKPSSAELVYRFLEFRGVGQKIGTMAANILARDFKVPLKDYYSIDISVDIQVRRVFERLELVEPASSVERIIYRARSLHPEFPGLLDFPTWEVGRNWCRPSSPNCAGCYLQRACPSAHKHGEAK